MRRRKLWSWLVLQGLIHQVAFASQLERPASAWEVLQDKGVQAVERAPEIEQELLKLLTLDQVEDYLGGKSPKEIRLLNSETLDDFFTRKGVSGFDLSWYSIDAGAATASGGDFLLRLTAGQVDAGSMSGGQFSLIGGFMPTPTVGTSRIHYDGFESGDTSGWE